MALDLPIHGYAAAVIHLYKGKEVDIFAGDSKTKLIFKDWETELKSIIRGTIKEAIGDALLIECKTPLGPKEVLINVWSIKTVVPVDGATATKDFYHDEHVTK